MVDDNRVKPPKTSGVLPALSEQAIADSHRWFPTQDPLGLPFYVLALAGEVGELANLVKKIERGSLDVRDAKVQYEMVMEATDVFIYLLIIAGLMNTDLEASYGLKRAYNERRFGPNGNGQGEATGAQRLVRPAVRRTRNGGE